MQNVKPSLAITPGDPAGIGPEVARKAIQNRRVRAVCRPILIEFPSGSGVSLGKPSRQGGEWSYQALCQAVAMAKRGWVDGIVTAPIDKRSWEMAGVGFPGHTEALAAMFGTKRYAMMFFDRTMRVTLATRHVPLARVSRMLTPVILGDAITLTVETLRRYLKIRRPRIVVLGLNPHGGQDNLFGDEERKVITPTLERLRKRLSAVIVGPVPADSAFRPAMMKTTDAYVAMYHDQGLIPFKMLAFERGVNVTVGLPFIRTSPDHGTAYDLAGKGRADPASMIEAIILAARMARSTWGAGGAVPAARMTRRSK